VVDGYLLALAAMILPAGSISDLVGRVPVSTAQNALQPSVPGLPCLIAFPEVRIIRSCR
jgi:hypothetical protein